MSEGSSFADWMARLRAGDEAAAAQVFHRFAGRLIALARSRLEGRLRQKVDPEDVLQSVYKSFFLRQGAGQFTLEGWDGLWAVLTVLTLRKCGRWSERFHAGRRDVLLEVPGGAAADESGPGWEALAREPTPPEAAMLAETVERLLAGLEPRDREIVTLSLQGYTVAEVSTQVGRTRRTVQRVLRRVREQLHEGRGETT